jgi:TolA-binding protein
MSSVTVGSLALGSVTDWAPVIITAPYRRGLIIRYRRPMAQKLGFLDQLLWGDHADRAAINRNAAELDNVSATVADLRKLVHIQSNEILQLRGILNGLVEVLQQKVSFTDAELEGAVRTALDKLAPPPPPPTKGYDPYRNLPQPEIEASPEEIAAANALHKKAQDHHFSKRFKEAREVYQEIVDKYGHTGTATHARQQLENLKKA